MPLSQLISKKKSVKSIGKISEDAEIIKFSEKPGFDYSIFLVVGAAVIAVAGTALLWLGNKNTVNALAEKKTEKTSIVSQITSPTYAEVEQTASNLKSAVGALKDASSQRYSMSELLPEFYKYIPNDVKINSLSVDSQKLIRFGGVTKSYRSAADTVVALKSWPAAIGASLDSTSASKSDSGAVEVRFSVTVAVDTSKPLKEFTATASGINAASSSDSEINASSTVSANEGSLGSTNGSTSNTNLGGSNSSATSGSSNSSSTSTSSGTDTSGPSSFAPVAPSPLNGPDNTTSGGSR